jgi:hypothetical protein
MKKENNIKLHIISKIDCLRLAATKHIIQDSINLNNMKIETTYELYFETQFDNYIQKLLKDNFDSNIAKSPIIYTIVKSHNTGKRC